MTHLLSATLLWHCFVSYTELLSFCWMIFKSAEYVWINGWPKINHSSATNLLVIIGSLEIFCWWCCATHLCQMFIIIRKSASTYVLRSKRPSRMSNLLRGQIWGRLTRPGQDGSWSMWKTLDDFQVKIRNTLYRNAITLVITNYTNFEKLNDRNTH